MCGSILCSYIRFIYFKIFLSCNLILIQINLSIESSIFKFSLLSRCVNFIFKFLVVINQHLKLEKYHNSSEVSIICLMSSRATGFLNHPGMIPQNLITI